MILRFPSLRLARFAAPVLVAAAVLTSACSGDGTRSAAPTTTTIEPENATESPGATPQPSPRQAAEALLRAEKAGDHATSYRLLTGAARKALSAAGWARRRSEVPAITSFTVEKDEGGTVLAIVEHEPGLDPFIGLSPAKERQTWRARKEAGGWLLDPEPVVEALYPSAADAPPAARTWALAMQSCEPAMVRPLQAVEVLYGTTDAPSTLCRAHATITVGAPERLAAGPSSQELVAQYGVDAFEWARTVSVTGGQRPFHAVLAPIGSVWRVVGVFEP